MWRDQTVYRMTNKITVLLLAHTSTARCG